MQGRWLSDLVLGAQDGIVNTLGVVLGASSATSDTRIILATGMAAAAAESISMAAVAFTSSAARGDLYRAERAREYRHIDIAPDIERSEIRALFAAKGFEGELLDRAVETVCGNKDAWVTMMMAEEHHLIAIDGRESMRSAAVVGGGSLVVSVALAVPFFLPNVHVAIGIAIALSALMLVGLGTLKARITTGSLLRSGATLALIGMTSAAIGYFVGALFAGK